MGIRFRDPSDSAASSAAASPSLREVLLFTTMSIIGLTVEVHIKDGSVYSGIFHTASVESGYGVVLKKARMIKKGTHAPKGVNRNLIDTLVVLPENLVQVLAKSVMISADGVCGGVGCDTVGAVTNDVKSYETSEKEATFFRSLLDDRTKYSVRQDGVYKPQEEGVCNEKCGSGYYKEEASVQVHEVQASSTTLEGRNLQVKSRKENDKVMTKQLPNGTPGNIAPLNTYDNHHQSQADSNAVKSVSIMPGKACSSSATTTPVVPVQNSIGNKSSKESKLNPGAKIFSPSFTNVRSVAAPPVLPAAANVAYVPNYFPAVPHVTPQPEIGMRSFPPCTSLPLKFVSYGNMATANGGSGLQYTQPMAVPIPSRPQPVRYTNQYQSIQTGPPYVQHTPQNGLMGRTGQLVYLNPATHEMVPGPPPFSHAPYPQLASHAVHIPKHEGVIAAPPPHLSLTPPIMVSEHLPFAVTNHIPLPQPAFPTIRPIPVFGASNPYGAKFF